MSAVERIREAVNVRELLGIYNAQHIKGSGNVRCCCPIHSGDNQTAFVFSEHEKLWYCHTGTCGGGDCFDFVMEMEECNFMSAVRKLAELFHVTVDWENEEIEENPFREQAKAFIEQMMKKKNVHVLPAFKPPQMKLVKINSYRGYSPETIEAWKLRMCVEGELKDRIVIPFEDVDRRLVGITGRATLAEQKEKFLHRPRNLHTGYFLTGLGRNLKYVQEAGNTVKIVEGVFDCCRWYEAGFKNVSAPIGLFFTDEHILQLYKAGVTTIELGFDGDKAGRNGIRKAIKKAKNKFDIYVLEYPDEKDADDCTIEELIESDKNKLLWWEWLEKHGEELEK
jgi:DNA primase